jgi:hypothetical protein
VGTNVFVLFDTSNFMYHGFVYAEDAIADFVRGLDRADSVAVYTFSRNLSRAANLTRDRNDAIFGLRKSVAGDDTALYNGLLLTLRDAAKVPGRKVVIVFSNGPDNASMVAPDDVRAVAEDEGIPIYVISTNDVNKDPISSNVFKRIATRHRRQGLLGQDLAETGGSVRSHPRRPGQFVHGDVLSGAQSERRIPARSELGDSAAIQFYDRSPICTLALAQWLDYPPSDAVRFEMERICRDKVYRLEVFFVRSLGFMTPTEARRISLADAIRFGELHESLYLAHGFQLIYIDPGTAVQRVQSIKRSVDGIKADIGKD